MLPGQLVPIGYNLYFGPPASTAYNTILAGDRWPVWLGKLSSWVSGVVREIPLNGLEVEVQEMMNLLFHNCVILNSILHNVFPSCCQEMTVIKDPENTPFNTADNIRSSYVRYSNFFIGWAIK
jgi:hypothetical protein